MQKKNLNLGITRKVDGGGRVVIPKSILNASLIIPNRTYLKVFIMEDKIILSKNLKQKIENAVDVGITRKIDEVGRYVIPREVRNNFYIEENKTKVVISLEDDLVILKVATETSIPLLNTIMNIIEEEKQATYNQTRNSQRIFEDLKRKILKEFDLA